MKVINHFLVILIILISCTNADKNTEAALSQSPDSNLVLVDTSFAIADSNEFIIRGVYLFEDDSIFLRILINEVSSNEIHFNLEVKNKLSDCNVSLTGSAFNRNGSQDPEIDEDEEGLAYPVVEYLHEKEECGLSIRLAMREKDKVIIQSMSCPELGECNLISGGIMRRDIY